MVKLKIVDHSSPEFDGPINVEETPKDSLEQLFDEASADDSGSVTATDDKFGIAKDLAKSKQKLKLPNIHLPKHFPKIALPKVKLALPQRVMSESSELMDADSIKVTEHTEGLNDMAEGGAYETGHGI